MTSRTGPGTVLVIDDDGYALRHCHRVADRSGLALRCLGFPAAAAALDWLAAEGPRAADAILLDVNMPGMTGFDFLAAAEARFGAAALPPVLMMLTTALPPALASSAARFASLRGFVEKPVSAADLARALALAEARRAA